MKNKELDVVILMKKVFFNDVVGFKPIKCVEGYYDEEQNIFYDLEGTPYYHIIEEPESIGFCDRENLDELRNAYIENILSENTKEKEEIEEFLSMEVDESNKEKFWNKIDEKVKEEKLNDSKTNYYCYFDEINNDFQVPVVLYRDINEKDKGDLFLDAEVVSFYYTCYPEFFKSYFKLEEIDIENEEKTEKKGLVVPENKKLKEIRKQLDISKAFKEITKTVIDQDNPIRKILTAVWKQMDNFSEEKSRNILINGGTGVGKTEIFRILTKIIDIPCVMTSATQYSGTGYIGSNVEDMLVSLLKRTDGDLEKAERGILIIDEVDKLAETNSGHSQVNQKDVQEALLKILEDGILPVTYHNRIYEFDTSKLMVVAMGSWSRVKVEEKKTIGFGTAKEEKKDKKTYKDITREDMVKNGMLPDFIGRFNTIIQMNDLNYESFLKILKSKNNVTALNRKFLAKKGVKLTIKNDAYEAIAEKASKSQFGARGLDEIVENALSAATFEIATHPNKYSGLIINKDTILNNENYKLIKRKK